MEADLELHHPGNPRANIPSGQLHTILEHLHPVPAQLILHRGQRGVVSVHSQSLQHSRINRGVDSEADKPMSYVKCMKATLSDLFASVKWEYWCSINLM